MVKKDSGHIRLSVNTIKCLGLLKGDKSFDVLVLRLLAFVSVNKKSFLEFVNDDFVNRKLFDFNNLFDRLKK